MAGVEPEAVTELRAALGSIEAGVARLLAALPSVPDHAVVAALGLAASLHRSSGGLQVALTREVVSRSDAPPDQSLCRRQHFRSPREMIEHSFGTVPGATSGLLAVAESTAERRGFSSGPIPPALGLLRKALDQGQLSVDQARVIASGLPPAHRAAHPEMLQAAEEALVGGATGGKLGQAPPDAGGERLRPELLKAQATLWNRAIDPDGLEPDERRQRAARSFRLSQRRDGMWSLTGLAPALDGAAMKTVLDAYTAPRVAGGTSGAVVGGMSGSAGGMSGSAGGMSGAVAGSASGAGSGASPGDRASAVAVGSQADEARADATHAVDADAADRRVPDQIRFDVLAALFAQHAASTAAPRSGGAAPTLMVLTRASAVHRTAARDVAGAGDSAADPDKPVGADGPVDADRPIGAVGPVDAAGPGGAAGPDSALEHGAWLPHTGAVVSIGSLARMICDAEVQFLSTDVNDEPLRLGRATRLFTPAQRRALMARDRRCRAPGCGFPASYCEAHHLVPWSVGGATDVENGILLCNFHHHEAHAGRVIITPRQGSLLPESATRLVKLPSEGPPTSSSRPSALACAPRSTLASVVAQLPGPDRASGVNRGAVARWAASGTDRPRLSQRLLLGPGTPIQRHPRNRGTTSWNWGRWDASRHPVRN